MSKRHMSYADFVNLGSSVNALAHTDISYIPELWDDGIFALPIRPGCNESAWFPISPGGSSLRNMDGPGTAS